MFPRKPETSQESQKNEPEEAPSSHLGLEHFRERSSHPTTGYQMKTPKLSDLIRIPKVRRVQMPLFEIASNPVIPLRQIKMRFNLMSSPDCCVCGGSSILIHTQFLYLVTFIGNRIVKTAPGRAPEKTYLICEKCLNKTRKRASRIRKMDPHKWPLYISDDNPLIRDFVADKLEGIRG
jgi:hypothetical protein